MIDEFAEALAGQLRACYEEVGWPFKSMTGFGRFLNRLFELTDLEHTQLVCLQELWEIAYKADQWGVQPVMASIINNGRVPVAVATDFAVNIVKAGARKLPDDLASPQPVIRNALAKIREQNQRTADEVSDMSF